MSSRLNGDAALHMTLLSSNGPMHRTLTVAWLCYLGTDDRQWLRRPGIHQLRSPIPAAWCILVAVNHSQS